MRWDIFKKGADAPTDHIVNQLCQCYDKDLEEDLFKHFEDISTIDEQELLQAIKQMAVISTVSVRKTELLSMRQGHGQRIRIFAARIKSKAQVFSLANKLFNTDC